MSDWKKIAKGGMFVGKLFAPGAFGGIIDLVDDSLENTTDAGNADALKAMAEAIVVLDERLAKLEAK